MDDPIKPHLQLLLQKEDQQDEPIDTSDSIVEL
jgi:hypothetical protein